VQQERLRKNCKKTRCKINYNGVSYVVNVVGLFNRKVSGCF